MESDIDIIGSGWSFPPRFDERTGAVRMTSGLSEIEEALVILVRTRVGERMMLPRYGVQPVVFERASVGVASDVGSRIAEAITMYEPRVRVISVHSELVSKQKGTLNVRVDFEVPSVNARANLVFPYFAREGTQFDQTDALEAT